MMESKPDVIQAMRSTTRNDFASEEERREAIREAQALVSRLETPHGTARRLVWTEPSRAACLVTVANAGLFTAWTASNGRPQTDVELAALVNADVDLIRRLLQDLAANDLVSFDASSSRYSMTEFTAALADGKPWSTVLDFYSAINAPSFAAMHKYFERNGLQNPTVEAQSIFNFAHGASLWDYLGANPSLAAKTAQVMKAIGTDCATLVGSYDTTSLVRDHPDGVLLVDCGRSLGQDTEAFRAKHPQGPGRLVLQDLPEVIEKTKGNLHGSIEAVSHNFFSPQPVQGAAAYYFHYVLHDWPDDKAKD